MLRAYLIHRNAEAIWKAVRENQALTITEEMEIHHRLAGDTLKNAPWPRVYRIPDPPFFMTEIVSAFVIVQRCY